MTTALKDLLVNKDNNIFIKEYKEDTYEQFIETLNTQLRIGITAGDESLEKLSKLYLEIVNGIKKTGGTYKTKVGGNIYDIQNLTDDDHDKFRKLHDDKYLKNHTFYSEALKLLEGKNISKLEDIKYIIDTNAYLEILKTTIPNSVTDLFNKKLNKYKENYESTLKTVAKLIKKWYPLRVAYYIGLQDKQTSNLVGQLRELYDRNKKDKDNKEAQKKDLVRGLLTLLLNNNTKPDNVLSIYEQPFGIKYATGGAIISIDTPWLYYQQLRQVIPVPVLKQANAVIPQGGPPPGDGTGDGTNGTPTSRDAKTPTSRDAKTPPPGDGTPPPGDGTPQQGVPPALAANLSPELQGTLTNLIGLIQTGLRTPLPKEDSTKKIAMLLLQILLALLAETLENMNQLSSLSSKDLGATINGVIGSLNGSLTQKPVAEEAPAPEGEPVVTIQQQLQTDLQKLLEGLLGPTSILKNALTQTTPKEGVDEATNAVETAIEKNTQLTKDIETTTESLLTILNEALGRSDISRPETPLHTYGNYPSSSHSFDNPTFEKIHPTTAAVPITNISDQPQAQPQAQLLPRIQKLTEEKDKTIEEYTKAQAIFLAALLALFNQLNKSGSADNYKAKVEELEGKVAALTTAKEEALAAARSEMDDKVAAARAEMDTLVSKLAAAREEVDAEVTKAVAAEKERLNAELEKATSTTNGLQEQLKAATGINTGLQGELDAANAKNAKLESQLEALKSREEELKAAQQLIDAQKQRIEELTLVKTQLEAVKDSSEEEISAALSAAEAARKAHEDAKARIQDLEKQLEEKTRIASEAEAAAAASEKARQQALEEASTAQSKLEDSLQQLAYKASEIEKLQQTILEQSLKIAELKAKLEAMKEQTTQEAESMKENMRLQIEGINKTLAEAQTKLAAVNAEFTEQTAKLKQTQETNKDLQAQLAALEAKTKENELDPATISISIDTYKNLQDPNKKGDLFDTTKQNKKSLSYLMLLLKNEVNNKESTFENILKYDDVVSAYLTSLTTKAPMFTNDINKSDKIPITKKDLDYFFNVEEIKKISEYVNLYNKKDDVKKLNEEYGKLIKKYSELGKLTNIQLGNNKEAIAYKNILARAFTAAASKKGGYFASEEEKYEILMNILNKGMPQTGGAGEAPGSLTIQQMAELLEKIQEPFKSIRSVRDNLDNLKELFKGYDKSVDIATGKDFQSDNVFTKEDSVIINQIEKINVTTGTQPQAQPLSTILSKKENENADLGTPSKITEIDISDDKLLPRLEAILKHYEIDVKTDNKKQIEIEDNLLIKLKKLYDGWLSFNGGKFYSKNEIIGIAEYLKKESDNTNSGIIKKLSDYIGKCKELKDDVVDKIITITKPLEVNKSYKNNKIILNFLLEGGAFTDILDPDLQTLMINNYKNKFGIPSDTTKIIGFIPLLNTIERSFKKDFDYLNNIFQQQLAGIKREEEQIAAETKKKEAEAALEYAKKPRPGGGSSEIIGGGLDTTTRGELKKMFDTTDHNSIFKYFDEITKLLRTEYVDDLTKKSDPAMVATLMGDKSVFNRIYDNYKKGKDEKTDESILTENIVQGLEANNVIPREVLKVTLQDKVVFIFATLFIRLIVLSVIEFMIEKSVIKNMVIAVFGYLGLFTILFLAFVMLVNLDMYRMRIVFNYINFHANSANIYGYLVLMWVFGWIIYYVMRSLNQDIRSTTSNEETRVRLIYRIQVLSLIIWLFLVLMVMIL